MDQYTQSDLKTCGVEQADIWGFFKALWLNPPFLAIYTYRKAARLFPYGGAKRLLARALWRYAYTHCGCDIKPYSTLGARVHLPHPLGVVIGADAVIGDDVTIYQNVTIGEREPGQGQPVIKNGAVIYAGACVLGAITIGQNAVVSANAVVLEDVPDNALAAGVPARIINKATAQSAKKAS